MQVNMVETVALYQQVVAIQRPTAQYNRGSDVETQ